MRPTSKSDIYTNGAIYLLVFIFGYNINKIIPFSYFEIDKTINIVDVFSILITICVAILISTKLEKHKQDSRNEKDIILGRVEELYQNLENISAKITSTDLSLNFVVSELKKSYVRATRIGKIISLCKIKCNESKNIDILTKIRLIRNELTDTPISESTNEGSTEFKVENGILFLSEDKKIRAFDLIENLKDDLIIYQIEINKA